MSLKEHSKMAADRDLLTSYEAAALNTPIDYSKIAAAIEYYKKVGFTYIDVPWDTPKKHREITFIGKDFNPIGEDRFLVGSAEQSFAYLADIGKLKRGPYVACTPCFRSDEIDETHQQYFMKVELFDTNDPSIRRLHHIIKLAERFFSTYIPVRIVETSHNNYDIETTSGIELGSYGIRAWHGLEWIFATGLAEPRLSKAMQRYN